MLQARSTIDGIFSDLGITPDSLTHLKVGSFGAQRGGLQEAGGWNRSIVGEKLGLCPCTRDQSNAPLAALARST
jgi:hypothetical protein